MKSGNLVVVWNRQCAALRPPIVILDADDVVLAEIAAGLNLDQLEQDLAGILDALRARLAKAVCRRRRT